MGGGGGSGGGGDNLGGPGRVLGADVGPDLAGARTPGIEGGIGAGA